MIIKKCKQCTKEFSRTYESSRGEWEKRQFCSKPCGNRYKAKKRYKGGWLDYDGYKIRLIDGKKVREHRLIMEVILGRKLLPTETVHHKNHVRADNRPENLIIVKNASEHNKLYHPTTNTGCEIKDCERPHGAKGLCRRHYYQNRYLRLKNKWT